MTLWCRLAHKRYHRHPLPGFRYVHCDYCWCSRRGSKVAYLLAVAYALATVVIAAWNRLAGKPVHPHPLEYVQ